LNTLLGKLIEFAVATRYAKEKGETFFIPVGYFPSYDCISVSKKFCLEIKFEAMAKKTMNFAFEYFYNGQPSGLASTKARIWLHIVPIDCNVLCCYEFSVEALRKFLNDYPLYSGGDGRRSQMKLLPLPVAEKIKLRKFNIVIDWETVKPYWN
jgi:hypothetical protein